MAREVAYLCFEFAKDIFTIYHWILRAFGFGVNKELLGYSFSPEQAPPKKSQDTRHNIYT